MASTVAHVNGIDIAYEVVGHGEPVLLLVGLGGVGRGWGPQVDLFSRQFQTIVPDHRGTGGSSRLDDGYTIHAHAQDMAELLRRLDTGPAHVVGSSTGGAIAQVMALDHPDVVRSITLVSSWTRADDYFLHQFAVRKEILVRLGSAAYATTSALFLFSPRFFHTSYDEVRRWCGQAGSNERPDIMQKRIDMILAFDETDRLDSIRVPALVVVGSADACTPPYFSEELASRIPGSRLVVLAGGHLIYKEDPEGFHSVVRDFLIGP